MHSVSIRPKAIALVLACSIALLATAHFLVSALQFEWVRGFGLHRFFSMGAEGNLPTLYSTVQLLVAALLLTGIAVDSYRHQERHWRGWALLALGFFMMSIDESAQVHDGVVDKIVVQLTGRGEGIWHYVWYVAYIPLLIALSIIFLPFLRGLPRRYLKLFVGAGFLFLGGAIGIEMGEAYLDFHQMNGMILGISLMVEESFELAGVALFIYSLLCYIGDKQLEIRLLVQSERPLPKGAIAYVNANESEPHLNAAGASHRAESRKVTVSRPGDRFKVGSRG